MSKFVPKQNYEQRIIHIYTDGGCRSKAKKGEKIGPETKSAFAYFLKYGGAERLDGKAMYGKTNNAMEITGLLEALKAIKNSNIPVKAYLDSAYVINTIDNKWYVKWRENGWTKKGGLANAELWKELVEQIERFPFFELVKVKGHSGDEYNELVDSHLNKLMDDLPEFSEEVQNIQTTNLDAHSVEAGELNKDSMITDDERKEIEKEEEDYRFNEKNRDFVLNKLNQALQDGMFLIPTESVNSIKEVIELIKNNEIRVG